MESTIRQTTDIKHELDVSLTKEELNPYFDAVYREAQKNISMKGFRKGKVPIQMIRKMYGPSLEQEAMEEAVQQEFAKCVQAQDLRPIGQPAITKIDRAEDGGVSFTVAYEVMPEFTLGEYKGLSARRIYHVVSEEEVDSELQNIREGQATLEDAEAINDENHTTVIDLVRLENGEKLEEGAMRDVPVYLRRNDVNPELKASLLNTKPGDTFTLDLPTGENEEMNTYEVTVKQIKRVVLPELDDTLASKLLGEGTPIEELTDYVRQSLNAEYERRYTSLFRDELINGLLERHEFNAPDSIVAEVLRSFIDDLKKGKNKQLPQDFDQAKFIQENRPLAERTAKWALIRDKVIQAENLNPDDADYEGLADIESQRTGIDYETLLNYLKNSDAVRDRILAEKALQLLEDYAIVNEVEDREVMAQEAPAGAENAPVTAPEQEADQEG